MCKSMRLSRLDLNFKVFARGDGKLFWPSCDLGSAPVVLMGKKPRCALRALTSADTHPRKELSAVCRPPDTPSPPLTFNLPLSADPRTQAPFRTGGAGGSWWRFAAGLMQSYGRGNKSHTRAPPPCASANTHSSPLPQALVDILNSWLTQDELSRFACSLQESISDNAEGPYDEFNEWFQPSGSAGSLKSLLKASRPPPCLFKRRFHSG